MLSAVHVWSPVGLPLHLSVRANCQGFHQCRCLPRYRLTATEHAGVTPPPAHGDLLSFQSKSCWPTDGLIWRLPKAHMPVCSDFRVSCGEPASHQHGGAVNLLGVFGRPGACQGNQHSLSEAPAHTHPCGDPHSQSANFILVYIWSRHWLQYG